jgi:putative ABC transport system ATP-binding protein
VLHEPTTAVDSVTESQIAPRLREIRSGSSTVLVTTSPAMLAACDRVLWIRDGAENAAGTHAELMDHPEYSAMFA